MTSAKKIPSIVAPFQGSRQIDPQVEVVELGLTGRPPAPRAVPSWSFS
jgi:hypothetical protein